MPKPLPSVETLRKLLRYDPEAGKLYWRERPIEMFEDYKFSKSHAFKNWNSRYLGKEALTGVVRKHRRGSVAGVEVYAHRVAWAMHHGEWPSGEIDHINGDGLDNRIENLRCVTRQENMKNTCVRSNSTSRITGVSWCKRKRKWRAYISWQGRQVFLGYHSDIERAKAARKLADKKYGFHENHGRQ